MLILRDYTEIIMKVILALLLVVTVSASNWLFTFDAPQDDLVKGFFQGIGEKGNSADFMKCLGEMNDLKKKIDEALNLILKLTYVDVAKGVRILIEVLGTFRVNAEKCAKNFPAVKTFINGITHFDGGAIVKKVILNLATFINSWQAAFACFSRKDYNCVGKNLGTIGKALFMTTYANVGDQNQTLAFVTGLLKGIGETGSPLDLMKCLYDLDPSIQKIKDGLEQIKVGKFINVTTGLRMILEGVKEILRQGTPCFDKYETIQQLLAGIRQSNFDEIVRKLLNNIGRLILDVDFAINGFFTGNYEDAGKGLGDILKFLYLK